jgi:hypothetical protein
MGILDCGFLYSMQLTIAYSTLRQTELGKIEHNWETNQQTLRGYANVMGTVDLKPLRAEREYLYKKQLNARTKVDPRIDAQGNYHPITEMLVLDITADGKSLWTHDQAELAGRPLLHDVLSVEPFVNPWNEIEYYKLLLTRSENQHLEDEPYGYAQVRP